MRASLAMALTLTILLAACRETGPVVEGPAQSPFTDGVIPWSPRLAPPTASPMPTPTLASCHAADIQASFEGWGAAAGSNIGSFRLAPTSTACGLPARPSFQFVTNSGERIIGRTALPAEASVLVVRPAGKAFTFILVQWSNHGADSHWNCDVRSQPIAALEVYAAGEWVDLAFASAQPTFCVDPAESVFVEVIAPPTPLSTHLEPIFDTKIVAPAEARRGEHMRYVVQLTNRTLSAQRFTECPVYVQNIAGPQELGSGDTRGFRYFEHRQILNCAGVGSVPAGETITFEMYFDIPMEIVTGTYVLPWRLDGPAYSTGYKVSLQVRG